jgi:pectinesterase
MSAPPPKPSPTGDNSLQMRVSTALLFLLAVSLPAGLHAQTVVAADGSGQFKSVQQAVDAAPAHSRTRFVIHIKPGTYQERVTVPPEKTFLTLEGDDPRTTRITAGVHAGMPGPNGRPLITFGTPTVFIQANDFTAENLTFENSAGPRGQALALTIMSDRGVFRNCRFLGYQDTLLAQAGRQYFDQCYIEGAVDFIFGGSAAWFEGCEIHIKANGYITAPNTPKDQRYGYVFSHSTITSEPNVQTFLSRPWRPYGATVFLNTEMSEAVRPAGWNNWNVPNRERTARYAEYHSTGPGGDTKARGFWAHQLTDAEARELTVETVLGGIDGWNPKTGMVRSTLVVAKEAGAAKAAIAKDSVWIATTAGRNAAGGLRFAFSTNGYQWTETGRSLPTPVVGQKQMIGPRLVEGPDGTFHLVWATGSKGDKGFGYASSTDLVHWSEQKYVEIMAKEDALDLASANLFYDEVSRRFVVTWASTIAKNFIQSFQEEVEDNPRIWYTTTGDFQVFSDPELLFDPNYSVRDGAILEDRGRYVLVHNDNTRPMLSLRVSASSTPFGPWGPSSDAFTDKFTESPTAIQSGRDWWIYYTNAQTGSIGLVKTRDFRSFQDASSQVSFPEGRCPVSVLKLQRSVLTQLAP